MSFFKKILGNNKEDNPIHENFQEGDIFYTEEDCRYQIFKLLRIDNKMDGLHVLGYDDTTSVPAEDEIENLKIKIYHFPIDRNGFNQPKFIRNSAVTENELLGYFEYIKQTNYVEEIVKYANDFYQQAHKLTDQMEYLGAIERYSKAIDLMPSFFEAIDNRAFCFMDLGKWNEAIEGFEQSLKVNPNSLLALFSIGECYFRLEEYPKAKDYFEQAIQVDPSHPKPKEFLEMTQQRMNK